MFFLLFDGHRGLGLRPLLLCFALKLLSFLFFFYSVLRWSVAVSTMRRQSSRIAAFLQANARPMFCWPMSASTARNQVWLGLPNGRFQSGGSPRITAATAQWWSSCGELRTICPKNRKRLGERMASGGCSDIRYMASIWYHQDLAQCPHVNCQMHQCETMELSLDLDRKSFFGSTLFD